MYCLQLQFLEQRFSLVHLQLPPHLPQSQLILSHLFPHLHLSEHLSPSLHLHLSLQISHPQEQTLQQSASSPSQQSSKSQKTIKENKPIAKPIKIKVKIFIKPPILSIVAKRFSKKQIKKLWYKQCFFCGEEKSNLLDLHRIAFGKSYHTSNTLVCCVLCHRRIHTGEIIVEEKKYQTTSGKCLIHYWINKEEFWKYEIICPL